MAPKQSQAGPSRIKASSTQAPPPPASVAAFNPTRTLFACAQPVLGSADKLTVWDVVADRVIAEWEVEGAAKATTVVWSSIPDAAKKKKRRKSGAGHEGDEDVVALTTDKGSLIVFAPRRGEVLRRLDVGRVHAAASSDRLVLVTATDILVIDRDLSAVANTYGLPAGATTPTAATILSSDTDIIHLLIASSSVISLHISLEQDKLAHSSSPLPVSTSHVSSLVSLPTSSHGQSFLVLCDDDRTVSQYTLPQPSAQANLSYRFSSPTISPVHSVSTSADLISVLHSSGEVSLFPTPRDIDFVRPKSDSKPSLIKVVEGKEDSPVRLAGVAFASDDDATGTLLCGKIFGGGRIKWLKAVYERPEGGVKAETVVKTEAHDLAGSAANLNSVPVQRFAAPATNLEAPPPEDEPAAALPADVDQADLSLGERLLALPDGENAPSGNKVALPTLDGPVNAASLTRLLVQALHTSDPALLTLCLSHRDPALIRNTIRKMPTQLALPLLKACVERLGQGKAAGKRGGGRGVAPNEQQGRGTVEWVKGVLVERGSVLMTMPSLPLHLATLSSLLQTRMQLYQPLLSLSGRLDLALAQISMRRIAAEQITQFEGKGDGAKYVEGESDDSDDDDDVHVEVDDDNGEIEDVDMMERDEESDSDDDSEDDSDDPLESGSEDGGFVDDEAEESGSAESDEDDE